MDWFLCSFECCLMMASNEISKYLKWKRLIIYGVFLYRTPGPLITGEKLLGTLKIRYEFCFVSLKSWKTNQGFIALTSAGVLPICLLKRMSAALRLRKSCSRRWKVPFQLLQRDFLGTCRMWVSCCLETVMCNSFSVGTALNTCQASAVFDSDFWLNGSDC